MDEQQQIEIDAFEVDGDRLFFEHGVILIDGDSSQQARWQAVFLHPRSGDAPSTPVLAPVLAHTIAGKQLKGIWRGDPARGAGTLVLHGLGPLEFE